MIYSPPYGSSGGRVSTPKPPQKILLVDGYNVINRLPDPKPSLDGGLENAQNRKAAAEIDEELKKKYGLSQ